MKIDELAKLCREYDLIKSDISTIEKNIDTASMKWIIDRENKKLIFKTGRKKEIEEIFKTIKEVTL